MNKSGMANEEKDGFGQNEERAQRFMTAVAVFRCVIGPLVLFGLLLATAHWEPAVESPAVAVTAGHSQDTVRPEQ